MDIASSARLIQTVALTLHLILTNALTFSFSLPQMKDLLAVELEGEFKAKIQGNGRGTANEVAPNAHLQITVHASSPISAFFS